MHLLSGLFGRFLDYFLDMVNSHKNLQILCGGNKKADDNMVVTELDDFETEIKKKLNAISTNDHQFKVDFSKYEIRDEIMPLLIKQQNKNLSEKLVYQWTVKNVEDLTKNPTFECESDEFPLKDFHISAKAKLTLKSDDIIYFSFCFIGDPQRQLPLKFVPKISVILRDPINTIPPTYVVRSIDCPFATTFKYDIFYPEVAFLHRHHLSSFENDTLELLITIGPIVIMDEQISTDGLILQHVTNYIQQKRLAKSGCLNDNSCPYFYSNEYRVLVNLIMDGYKDFEGKGLTAMVMFVTGEFDSKLSTSYKHRTTLTLINQLTLRDHLVRSVVVDIKDKKRYFIHVATHEEIEIGGFVLNNSLLIKVYIQPILSCN